jgi:hypothetical protein
MLTRVARRRALAGAAEPRAAAQDPGAPEGSLPLPEGSFPLPEGSFPLPSSLPLVLVLHGGLCGGMREDTR